MRKGRMLALGASLLTLLVGVGSAGGGSTFAHSAVAPGRQAAHRSVEQDASGAPSPSAPSSSSGVGTPTIKIGSDGFYEAMIVAEIYAEALEAHGYTVDRTGIGIGARSVSAPALVSGQIDLKPEYVGSGLKNISLYAGSQASGSPAAEASAAAPSTAAPSVNPTDPNSELAALQQDLAASASPH